MQLVDLAENPLPPRGVAQAVLAGRVVLRVARWTPDAPTPRGTVTILPGRSEFIEKYAEVVGALLAREFAVVVIDWRGQGGSGRLLPDPRRGHVRSFDEYRTDLDAVIEQVLRPHCPEPFFALAHSMGGAIMLDHARRRSGPFRRIVLSAPMLDLYGLRLPRTTRRLAATVALLGGGRRYIPGGSERSWMSQPFENNGLTSDRTRYAAFNALAAAAPQLVIGAPTFGWLHAAFRIMDGLARDPGLDNVAVPVLAVACGSDRVVDTPAIERLVARLRHGRTITVPFALHEILMEREPLRAQFWAAFDSFIPGTG